VSDGSIACQGLLNCNGKQLWIDGSNFNATFFTTISDIQITSGHRLKRQNDDLLLNIL
jgi:hypothetical protein